MTRGALTPLQVLDSFPAHEGTLSSLLASRCRAVPQRELLSGEIRPWTYAAAQHAAERIAAQLVALGVVKGDRVACVSHNSDLVPLLFLAIARLGAVFVPGNPASPPCGSTPSYGGRRVYAGGVMRKRTSFNSGTVTML